MLNTLRSRLKALFTLSLLLMPLFAAAAIVEGEDYQVLAAKPAGSGAVLVREFFSFGCPACYRLEPTLQQWVKAEGKKIRFVRTPVIFRPAWEVYARAWYASDTLGLSDAMAPKLFAAVQDEKHPLESNAEMIAFFVENGVQKDVAESAFTHSTAMDMALGQSVARMSAAHINAVPAIVVGNRYKTDLQMAKSPERLLEVLDYLVKKAQTA
ncbi:thiol:disulfide interchange protein DsbA/DsbL [Legionella geestiana]|uniref:thiol:disulfide interchange protein DsbA/DsbL n=1 Tax=Legionella geestiana TaxID=45065 RepID=UPI001FE4E29E|nr:thiol:disulfide interchange protein DsbA/DsbL [Legionella geestiana]